MFGNCSYYDCDSSQIYIHFTPASVEPGGSTIIKLWITPNQYEYNEDNHDILQKTITIEPECGQLTYLGGGEYLFTAPDTLTVDSTVVIINYENYNQFCARWNAEGERMIVKDNFDCINCPMPLFNILQRDYAAEQLTIKWDSLFVEVSPTELFPGDTADINIKKRLPDGTLTDFDTTQTFEAAMLEGCTLGNILVDDSIDVYFYDINQPIKFVADTTADSTGLVLLRIGLVEEIAMLKSNNDEDVLFDCLPGPPQTSNYAIVQAYINEEPTILLGETKYYQARYKTVDELMIEEAPVDANGIPYLDGGLSEDVWGNNPVTVIDTCNDCAKKMGVYWEKKYPTNEFENVPIDVKGKTYNHSIIKMNPLQSGLIRLVGRYWDKDSTYFITLKAKRENGDSAQIQIKIVKPSMIWNGQNSSFEKAKDVLNNTVNIDSLCIFYGGIHGIPPQLIKGQMFTESAKTYFNSLSDSGFAPSYRFEPFTTQYEPNYKTNPKYNSYYIYDSTYTYPNMPTHYNVQLINYPSQIYTVWDMVKNYSKLVNPNPDVNYYGGRNSTTHRVWLGYTVVDTIYTRIANEFAELYPELTNVQKYDSTNNKMIDFLKNEWTRNDAPKGTKNNIAQTRVASSYGLAQFLYGTARDIGYPKEDVPENINLMNYVYLFYKTQKKYLCDGLGINVESSNNWSEGYEHSFCKWIYDSKWNPYDLVYSKKIINNSKRFFPQ
ncbi:MAG: hypothetical protein HS131_08650 [Ignavibacteriales bacterium]|nr:hypothetical protein [Ignavibacteriales bacterium]